MPRSRPVHGASIRLVAVGSLGLCKIRYRSVLVTALTFALLIAVVVTFMTNIVENIQEELILSAGITSEELSTRLESALIFPDESSAETFFTQLLSLGFPYKGTVTADNIVPVFILKVGPYALFLALFEIFVLTVSFVYFLVFFLSPSASEMDALLLLPKVYARFVLLSLWLFVRSMIWIPFIGPLIAVYLCPRFVLAPVSLASGRLGIVASVTSSVDRTKGSWVLLFSAILLWFLLSVFALWCVIVLASIPTVFLPKLGYIVLLVGIQCIVAYSAAYLLVLSELSA